jgi:hypothetical protein
MNIYTLRDNLKSTIEGKQQYLEDYLEHNDGMPAVKSMMIQVIEMNLEELRKILADVEVCCKQAIEDSWKGSVDRQGGSFDASEYNRETWI